MKRSYWFKAYVAPYVLAMLRVPELRREMQAKIISGADVFTVNGRTFRRGRA